MRTFTVTWSDSVPTFARSEAVWLAANNALARWAQDYDAFAHFEQGPANQNDFGDTATIHFDVHVASLDDTQLRALWSTLAPFNFVEQ